MLRQEFDLAEFATYKAAALQSPLGREVRARAAVARPTIAVMGLIAVCSGLVILGCVIRFAAAWPITEKVFPLLGAVLFGLVLVFSMRIARRESAELDPWRRWYELTRFAKANGLSFHPMLRNPRHDGLIFSSGEDRLALDVLATKAGRYVEIGNFRSVGEIGSKRVATWGYLCVQLDRPLPHMVAESRAHRRSELPGSFSRQQVLGLEGDFDKHFTLYAPLTYERDALYVFTPDLMAVLIDDAALFDLEVVEDRLYLYSRTPFDLLGREPYDLVARVLQSVGTKSIRRSSTYRAPAAVRGGAALPGPRLTQRVSPVYIAAAVVGIGVVAAGIVAIFAKVLGL